MNAAIQTLNVASGRSSEVVNESLFSSPSIPFDIENIQHLSVDQALQCQKLLGHGTALGQWETPRSLTASLKSSLRKIDIAARVKAFLPDGLLSHPELEPVMAEAVMYLTRWALLCRVGPVGFGPNAQGTSLDVSTIAQRIYHFMPQVIACGVKYRLIDNTKTFGGFVGLLNPDDLWFFQRSTHTMRELERMRRLVAVGLWFDGPSQVQIHSVTTSVKGLRQEPLPEKKPKPYQPLPDWYMELFGPRVLWLIKDLGPNLLHLLRHLLAVEADKRFKRTKDLGRYVVKYFGTHVWRDREGKALTPPFALRLSVLGRSTNPNRTVHAWPPRDYADVMSLAAALQRAHLFMALLLMAARHTEVLNLTRDCVEVGVDGQARILGKTYKATAILEGEDRKWPAPSILVYAFAQQLELVLVFEELESLLNESVSIRTRPGIKGDDLADVSKHLWVLAPIQN